MTRYSRILTLSALLALGWPLTATAQPSTVLAQWGVPRGNVSRAFDEGYRSGIREGERDARTGRRPDLGRHDDYRRGSAGWGWGTNRSADADMFRRGFAQGYREGYDRSRGGWGARPAYPEYGYGGGYGRPPYTQGAYASPAAQRGYQDGYRDGRSDGRGNDRYEPTRKRNYREGDDGYNSRYGSRERYKAEYRRAFVEGYARGYRER